MKKWLSIFNKHNNILLWEIYKRTKKSTKQNNKLTEEELQYFRSAEEIIKRNQHPNASTITVILLTSILICIILFCTMFAIFNLGSNKILKNISIMGIDVSNLTIDEANEKLNNELGERLTTDIVLSHNDEDYVLPPKAIEASFDIEAAVNEAYNIGKKGNLIQNNFAILEQKIKKTDLLVTLGYKDSLFKTIISQLNENFKDGVKDPSYSIDGTNLVISAGKDGAVVQSDELKYKIMSKLLGGREYENEKIEIPVENIKRKDINVAKIHEEIYKEPVDATYTINPYKITASQNGLDFNISVDEAKNLITGNSETYTIPLKILYPSVSTDDIGAEAFPDLLASYTTNYSSSNANRSNNIAVAASKINGTVLMPGDEFSYNGTVGQRTIASGFREAGAYLNGQVVSEVGGGICQVSSTLYNSVLRANLEVTDRTSHMFVVGYCPIGTDATVSWGAPDFKFKNNRNYAIRIVATTYNKNVEIQIYGLREDTDYEVEIESYRTGSIAAKTTYTTDYSLRAGQTKVIQSGSAGSTSVTYKILKKNGEVVDKVLVSRDSYSPHNQVVARGR